MSLVDARLASLVKDLLRLRTDISVFRDRIRTAGIAIRMPGIDDRELLRSTSAVKAELGMLRLRLERIASQIPELSRHAHRRRSTSAFGHLGNIRGTLPLVEKELAALEIELRSVHESVVDVMNDPRRTSSVPSGGLAELLDVVIELTARILERIRSTRA